MRFDIRLRPLVLLSAVMMLLVASSSAQQINFPNFSTPTSVSQLQLNGSSRINFYQGQGVLRLTNGSASSEQATSYFKLQQPVAQGFNAWFEFQIHNPTICCNPSDGFAFVIQNVTASDPSYGASGTGLMALGAAYGGLGYSGLNNNLAVEFDIHDDAWDPNSNHIAIQTCGANQVNTPVHEPGTYTLYHNSNVTSCLLSSAAITNNLQDQIGQTCGQGTCTDGTMHQAVVQYTPPVPPQTQGVLNVWLDPTFVPNTHTPSSPPLLSVPYNIVYSSSNPVGLTLNTGGTAYAGFTASQQANAGTTQDIQAWEVTPHGPVQITQTIPPGGTENDFVFGNYKMGVNYPTGFSNPNGIQMTVLSTPIDRNTFYTTRLLGTQFSNETCVVYLETGGNCVVHSVTCQLPNGQGVTCPSETDPTIAICSQFTTTDPVTMNNADYLEAEPIGSNNWFTIFSGFSNNDPVVSGKGRGFSDVVATFIRNHDSVPQSGIRPEDVVPKPKLPSGNGFCPPVM